MSLEKHKDNRFLASNPLSYLLALRLNLPLDLSLNLNLGPDLILSLSLLWFLAGSSGKDYHEHRGTKYFDRELSIS